MNYNFDCIAGYEREKEELKRLCDVINNRAHYQKLGAQLPKGIIFYGEPGTGKTLFAKVLASVCNLKIFKIDLGDVENESEICRHIKKTFTQAAQEKEPTMVFFDEVDKILPNDEERYYTDRSKTILTQLLTQIDGMNSTGHIIFVATCNYYSNLPETLVRPGRIDKKIGLGAPTYSSRVQILNMYAKRTACRFDVDFEDVASRSSGLTCSALETLINECVLQSDENGVVSEELVYERLYEIKSEDIPRPRSFEEDVITACRNVGAFVVSRAFDKGRYLLSLEDTVCSNFFDAIIDEYATSDDWDDDEDDWDDDEDDWDDDEDDWDDDDWDEEQEELDKYYSGEMADGDNDEIDESLHRFCCKDDLQNALVVLMGGYVAQEVVLHKTYSNIYGYLQKIDSLLIKMAECGMFGLGVRFSSSRNQQIPYSADRLQKINDLFDATTAACYEKAKKIIVVNRDLIKKLMKMLAEKQELDQKQADELIERYGGIIL